MGDEEGEAIEFKIYGSDFPSEEGENNEEGDAIDFGIYGSEEEDFILSEEFHPFFSNEPLPQEVKEAVANLGVIPINQTIDMLCKGPSDKILGLVEDNFPGTKESDFPTRRNETTRKVDSMDSVLEVLEEKLSQLQGKLEELEALDGELESAKEIAQNNIDAVEEAINSLDLNLEDFYFEADISFTD